MKQLIELNLSQEQLFVIFCCRAVSTDKSSGAIDDFFKKTLNWNLIFNIVSQHDIAGLLYVMLSQCSNIGHVPDYILKKLETSSRDNALRNLLYFNEFNEIIANFNRENIRTIPLKGIEFLHSIYAHNIALRNLADIDILVEKENVPRAEKILIDMGYKTIKRGYRYSLLHFHSIFWRSRGKFPIIIELHWNVDFPDSPFNIDIAEFWQRSQEISNGKLHYYAFSIEDSIIFNSFHILRTIYKKPDAVLSLKYFCDIANIIAQSGDRISWDCIIKRSQKYNVLRPVALVLLLVQGLLEVKAIPPVVAETLRNAGYRDDFGLCAVKEYIFPPVDSEKKQLPFWAVDLASQTTMWGKIKVILSAPAIIVQLYKIKHYAVSDSSVMKTVSAVIWYYINKIFKTMVLYVCAPTKARTLKKKLTIQNQKIQETINWILG
jgi:hypothetical protein